MTLSTTRQHGADLRLPIGGELVDDAIDRRRGGRRVQRAEHEVTRFGGLDGDCDRFEIAYSPTRTMSVLTQGWPAARSERARMRSHSRWLIGTSDSDARIRWDSMVIDDRCACG